jgi:hypothetical protein
MSMSESPQKTSKGWNVDSFKIWLEKQIAGNPSTRGGDHRSGKASELLDPHEVQLAKHKKTVVEYEAKQFDLDLKKGLYIERSKYMSRLHQLGSAVQLPLMQLMIKKQPVKLQMRDAGEIRAENTEDYNKICESMRELFRKWAQEDNADDNGSDDGDVGDGLEAN